MTFCYKEWSDSPALLSISKFEEKRRMQWDLVHPRQLRFGFQSRLVCWVCLVISVSLARLWQDSRSGSHFWASLCSPSAWWLRASKIYTHGGSLLLAARGVFFWDKIRSWTGSLAEKKAKPNASLLIFQTQPNVTTPPSN